MAQDYYDEWLRFLKDSDVHKHIELIRPDKPGLMCIVVKLRRVSEKPLRFETQRFKFSIMHAPAESDNGNKLLTSIKSSMEQSSMDYTPQDYAEYEEYYEAMERANRIPMTFEQWIMKRGYK